MFYELSNGDTYTCAGLGSRKGERGRGEGGRVGRISWRGVDENGGREDHLSADSKNSQPKIWIVRAHIYGTI